MLCVCVVDVMDVVFSVCIGRREAVGTSYGSSQCCMICRLLMLVESARSDYMEEVYCKAGLITAL